IAGAKEKPKGSGTYVDAHDHKVAQNNKDGSVTVVTDKGVYNVYPGGHLTKVETRGGTELGEKDLEKEGIKSQSASRPGNIGTTVEVSNGVIVVNGRDVSEHEASSSASADVRVCTLKDGVGQGNFKMGEDGKTIVYQKTGHPVARYMEDGSTR